MDDKKITLEDMKKFMEQADEWDKERINNMLHNKFPRFLKDFLNEFANTKFYAKTKEDKKWGYEELPDYFAFDWKCELLSPFKEYTDEEKVQSLLELGTFGSIPRYQYDELKVIVIDFKNKEAYLERGMATKLYASYVLKHKQEIPKYMQPLINKLWADYDEYMLAKESD